MSVFYRNIRRVVVDLLYGFPIPGTNWKPGESRDRAFSTRGWFWFLQWFFQARTVVLWAARSAAHYRWLTFSISL